MPKIVGLLLYPLGHVISRTALPGLPIRDVDKDYLLGLIKRLSRLYCVDVLVFAIMGNHFHLVARMHPEESVSDQEVIQRYQKFYGDEKYIGGDGKFQESCRF